MLNLYDNSKVISQEDLISLRDSMINDGGSYIPDAHPTIQKYVSEDILRLLNYIDVLEKEVARLRRNI